MSSIKGASDFFFVINWASSEVQERKYKTEYLKHANAKEGVPLTFSINNGETLKRDF